MSAMLGARLDLASFLLSPSPSPSPPSSTLRVRPSLAPAAAAGGARFHAPRAAAAAATAVSAKPAKAAPLSADRTAVRLGIASKGRMSDLTRDLLKSCQLTVIQTNPRQYIADIPQMPNLEVWLQRPTDIVRKLCSGDLDLGIVGYDIISEIGQGNDDLVIIHDALDFGHCHLSLAVPKEGIFQNINTLEELLNMPQWTEERPMRVVTGFGYVGAKFLKEKGFKHVSFLSGDGALESYPAMGMADVIVDLVSSGTTLHENNLKEIEGGVILESQAALVASRKSLNRREGALEISHEMLERLEAHLTASGKIMVTANMRGNSAEEVAERVLSQPSLCGLQGPTISPVYCSLDGNVAVDYYAINIVVPQKSLYKSIQQLRSIGGSGVLVSKLTYIFNEETPRWRRLLSELGM
uniref:Uncharacterized protein n=1 Tax=Avena sativa TaxID=4498 RepID=A0ACD5WVW0_AVESA